MGDGRSLTAILIEKLSAISRQPLAMLRSGLAGNLSQLSGADRMS
jgi:hypothetical protein